MPKTASPVRPRDIARRRLASQNLIGPRCETPVEVVHRLGAVQSQDYAGGKWAVGQRTRAATDDDVEQGLSDGSILRTHVLRPTWHFVAAQDIRWMQELTAPRVKGIMASYDRKLEIDEKVYARSTAAIAKALSGGNHLTRTELARVLARPRSLVGPAGTQWLAHLMMRAELDAVICSGVRRGKQSTYALVDERAPRARRMNRDEALAELTSRYFSTRGPATVQDFSWWSGLTVSDARNGVESLGSRLEHGTVDGRKYWFAEPAQSVKGSTSSAHLLPNYDEYFIGLKDRSAIQELVKGRVVGLPGDMTFAYVVMADGQLVGGWTRSVTTRKARLTVRLAVKVTPGQLRSIEAQARRYGEFLRLPVELEIVV